MDEQTTVSFILQYGREMDAPLEIFIAMFNQPLFVLKGILGQGVKIASINQLGGKSEVLKACRLDQSDDGRKKLYIIDGDLDLLTGAPKPRLKYLYRLRAYCFENLIITNRSILELGSETEPNTPPDQLEQRLDFPHWISTTTRGLLSLFILYGVARRLSPTVQTIGFNVHQLCTSTAHGLVLSNEKVRSRMRSLIRKVLQHSNLVSVRAVRKEVQLRASRYNPREYVISGKDYLFPLLRAKLRSEVNCREASDNIKVRLARHYDVAREPFLARRLRSL